MFKVKVNGREMDVEVRTLSKDKEVKFTKEMFQDFQKQTLDYLDLTQPFNLDAIKKVMVEYEDTLGCLDILITHDKILDETTLKIQVNPNMKANDWIFQGKDKDKINEFSEVCRVILSEFDIHQGDTRIVNGKLENEEKHGTSPLPRQSENKLIH